MQEAEFFIFLVMTLTGFSIDIPQIAEGRATSP
jgi:hypothetical protein